MNDSSVLRLRQNSRLRTLLDPAGLDFLAYATNAIRRILPHVEVERWREQAWKPTEAVWVSSERTAIRITVSIGEANDPNGRSLTSVVRRRRLPIASGRASRSLDIREYDICGRIAQRISHVLRRPARDQDDTSIRSIRDTFDEHVIAYHVGTHHGLGTSVIAVFDALHKLAEQSYENKALTFGCVLDPSSNGVGGTRFPESFLDMKKYKALSDGFRTAYHVSGIGHILDLVDLDRFESTPLTEKHFYPDWAESIARASRHGRCGICLSRQGDILVFDEGSLRFTYWYGRWQYWNHAHLVNLLRDRAAAQRVKPSVLGRVIGSIYRAALDVSFRRSGGLFVILHNRKSLREIVREGDAIRDASRSAADREFDGILQGHTIQALPRAVAVELASLDGAVVLDNSGHILAYGAVLSPRNAGRLRGTEGSRTKAAIGASHYGLSLKISSDGDMTVYFQGKEFIVVSGSSAS